MTSPGFPPPLIKPDVQKFLPAQPRPEIGALAVRKAREQERSRP